MRMELSERLWRPWGGWEEVNEWTVENWKFQRKGFESLYLANLRRGNIEPMKIEGIYDKVNGAMVNRDGISPFSSHPKRRAY